MRRSDARAVQLARSLARAGDRSHVERRALVTSRQAALRAKKGRSLYLNDVGATDAAAKALAASPHFSKLGYLEIKGNAITPEGRKALTTSEHWSHVTVEFGP